MNGKILKKFAIKRSLSAKSIVLPTKSSVLRANGTKVLQFFEDQFKDLLRIQFSGKSGNVVNYTIESTAEFSLRITLHNHYLPIQSTNKSLFNSVTALFRKCNLFFTENSAN